MLQKIHIQNFRSLKDVSLHLQDVNLLIGPNNSGKSNFLKVFIFLKNILSQKYFTNEAFNRFFFRDRTRSKMAEVAPSPIVITIIQNKVLYRFEAYSYKNNKISGIEFIGVLNDSSKSFPSNLHLIDIPQLQDHFNEYILIKNHVYIPSSNLLGKELDWIKNDQFTIHYRNQEIINKGIWDFGQLNLPVRSNLPINLFYEELNLTLQKLDAYSINVANIKTSYPTLENDYTVNSDASNLVAFLDNMRDAYPEVIQKINQNLQECIEEFRAIIFEKVSLSPEHNLRKIYGDKTFKRIGILDKYGQKYWADELSDGTLYFLALLAIIHQPNPPKLLLLEEPENGIHPRRIKEVVDFIFELAENKEVQVIMTTHSTVLIDQFEDLPENIFVFDKNTAYTTIKNLQSDILAEDKQQSEKLNLPQLDLSGSLGDHWASGLIGGVPK